MNKTLLIILFASILIISGCSNKISLEELETPQQIEVVKYEDLILYQAKLFCDYINPDSTLNENRDKIIAQSMGFSNHTYLDELSLKYENDENFQKILLSKVEEECYEDLLIFSEQYNLY